MKYNKNCQDKKHNSNRNVASIDISLIPLLNFYTNKGKISILNMSVFEIKLVTFACEWKLPESRLLTRSAAIISVQI